MRKASCAKTAFHRERNWQKQHASTFALRENLFKLFSCIVIMSELLKAEEEEEEFVKFVLYFMCTSITQYRLGFFLRLFFSLAQSYPENFPDEMKHQFFFEEKRKKLIDV